MNSHYSDILIIGSGLAALQTAIHASKSKRVTIVTKTSMRMSNSYLAQGGIAAAHAAYDNFESHIADTMIAGRFHNQKETVTTLVKEGVEAINDLVDQGMPFDRNQKNQLIYGLEGAHSQRRILHSHGDSTGKQLVEFLLNQLASTGVETRENELVLQLLLSEEGACIGAVSKDDAGQLHTYYASDVVLATGGCGGLYPYSTNNENATGDGYALALKAGAVLKDMEFVQFHPTGLYIDGKVRGLVSEAVRGEGAILIDEKGASIMKGVHELENLEPRHVVAQSIHSYIQKGKQVFLDISMIHNFSARFPTVTALCEKNGLNWREGKIPVAPASHFMMGGIETNANGETNVKHLYAVGEVACTGVHGANRLASNSLLEGLVFGKRVGNHLKRQPEVLFKQEKRVKVRQEKPMLPSANALKKAMFQYAGIVRDEKGLLELNRFLKQYEPENLIQDSFLHFSKEEAGTAFMVLTAMSIVRSALLRKESRGGHNRIDFPEEINRYQTVSTVICENQVEGRLIYEQVKA